MKNEVIIDGNNLIGKIRSFSALQKKDKVSAREKTAFIVDRYFSNKKINVYLHFDGFSSIPIKTDNIRIIYSNEKTADDKIKKQIEQSKNSRNITLVTSDRNLQQFGKVCSCEVISSEKFSELMLTEEHGDDEQSRIDRMNDIEEFKKIFKGR